MTFPMEQRATMNIPLLNSARLTLAALAVVAGPAFAQSTPFDGPGDAPRNAVSSSSPAASAPLPAAAPARRVAAATPRIQARAANQARPGEPALSCRTINWQRGDIIRLQAQPFKQIHVALPEAGIDVIMGDKELWALDWINSRIFIKPTSRSSEGRSTTISAIGQSGNAYEFLVTRVPENLEISHCVYIQADPGLISRGAWARAGDQRSDGSYAQDSRQEVTALRERNAGLERQARDSMKAYRKKLNSNYGWETGLFSRWTAGEIESVYDDGRFTYVRMKEGAQGLASIMAELDGKAVLLDYAYDEPTRTYQISGLFPKFTLYSGKQTLSITRKGERES